MENEPMIGKALEYIGHAWNDGELTLEKVAGEAGFSASYFDRLFAESVGRPVMEYVRMYRLTRSAQLLRTGDRNILDIALELGYSNPENFARAFKAQYGTAPSEYREKHEGLPLTWKDLSTGTAVRRFERAYPELRRVDPDELIDSLLSKDPVRYAATVCAVPFTDAAVYALGGGSEYLLLEEYRADEISLTLFCGPDNLRIYLPRAKKFPKYTVSFTTDADFVLPPDKFGFQADSLYELYDYAYLKNSIVRLESERFAARTLTAADESLVHAFSKQTDPAVSAVFKQKYGLGGDETVKLFGLFDGRRLVGCAMTTCEQGRDVKISDMGGVYFLPGFKTEENDGVLRTAAIDDALKNGRLPVDGGTVRHGGENERLGYTLISKRYTFTNIRLE